jgi:hypothetical protein
MKGGIVTTDCMCADFAESDVCRCRPCADMAAGSAICPHRLDAALAGVVVGSRYAALCDLCFEEAREVRDCGLRVAEHCAEIEAA